MVSSPRTLRERLLEYKHVLLGLIFLKYISDAFDEHRKVLVANKADGANPEDRDEYQAENVFWVPKEARWVHLQAHARQATIGKVLDDAMVAIERDNPSLKGVLPKEYGRPNLDKQRLGERGHKVMLDTDLAALYDVPVKALNQAVKRNLDRFPADFMFQLSPREVARLRSQIVTLDTGPGRHAKYPPYAFTEQGVAMLSSVLRSPRAVQVNIEIMRAFVRLRQMLHSNAGLTGPA